MERLMSRPLPFSLSSLAHTYLTFTPGTQNRQDSFQFARGKLRILEINPASPLIEGLLKRVNQLPGPDEEQDPEAEAELKEVVNTMVDGALVRSGFDVPDVNQ